MPTSRFVIDWFVLHETISAGRISSLLAAQRLMQFGASSGLDKSIEMAFEACSTLNGYLFSTIAILV
jgi:hypothetical protein